MNVLASLEALATSEDTAYVLSSDRRLVAMNEAWTKFATSNSGEGVLRRCGKGFCVDDVLPPPLRKFYVDGYERALATNERWDHEYECSSPQLYRRFRMLVYPGGGGELLVVHSLVTAAPHACQETSPDATGVRALGGLVTMCCHCRRVRRNDATWAWIPSFVAVPPPSLSHGLCEPCLEFYYPDA